MIIILIFTSQIVIAQTIIPGGTIDGEVWTTANSPYQIAGDLTITSLVIQPGVIIQFIDDFKFEIDGYLKAEGFYSDSIFFQPTVGNSQGWRGIKFKSTSIASSISYCRIEGANNQGIFIEQSSPAISNCRIVQNNGDGILIKNTEIELKNCIIDYNIGNGIILNAGQITTSNSIFARNNQAGVYSANSVDSIILINTVIADNQGIGVDCKQGALTIKNSIVYNNASQIFWQDQTPEVSYSDIQGSSVYPGYGNINTDPDFVDHSSFVLSELSSCVDAGDTNTVFEDKYFPPSKGGKRNDIGTYGGPEANGWYPPLFLDPQFVDFGQVRRDSSKIITMKIYNYLNTGITVPNISIEGTNSQVFSINKENFYLPVSNCLDFPITFTPEALEVFSSDLILHTQSNGDVSALLSGEGVIPEINILEQELNFQAVSLGTSATLDLHILNSGGDTLIIDLLSPSHTIFTVNKTSLKIDPDLSIDTLQITFTPDYPTTYQDSLILIHNDPDKSSISITLLGTGKGPFINVGQELFTFGMVPILSDSSKNLEIKNIGNETLTIENIVISEPDSIQNTYKINDTTISFPHTLESDSSLSLPIRFKPVKNGSHTAQLYILSNDPFRDTVIVELSGTGVAPQIKLSSMELDFGRTPLLSDSTQILYIYNNGLSELFIPIDSLYITGENANSFIIDNITTDIIVDQGSSVEIPVRFHPNSLGPLQAELQIKSNDPQNPSMTVLLTGLSFDDNAASISFNPDYSSNSFISGQTASIGFSIISNSPVDSAKLYIREGGKSQYTEKLLINQNDSIWTEQINATEITERGLEYYVRAYHGFNSTLHPENGENKPNSIQVDVPQIEYPESTKEGFYQMISVPLNTSDQDLTQMFLDDLGSYDNTKYRIFDYERDPGYIEISNMNNQLPPGKALWLITKNATKLDVNNVQSIRTDQDFMIQLKRGWNMIATPFAFPIDWNQISQSIVLRYYDGTDWPFASVLEPFKGYAVYVAENTSIAIPPRENQSVIHLLKTDLPQPENSWRFQISAYSGNLIDQFNYGGVKELATAAIDHYDYPEPPPIGDFISLYFTSKEHTIGYSTDYRELGKDGYTFDFELTSNVDGQKTIDIQPENLPMNHDWTVISNETNVNYMKESVRTSLKQAHFTLVIGTTDYIDSAIKDYQPLPSNYKLEQNYPNPFNSSTFIKFQLPHATRVTVEIINILGQNIKTLIQNELKEAGHYQVEWNGKDNTGGNVSSGIYILHLKTEQFTHSIKMILQK